MSDDEHDTEPSPPPSGNVTVIIPEADPVDALMARLEMTPTVGAEVPPSEAVTGATGVAPSPGDSVLSFHVVNGLVVEGPTLPKRDWYDYGLDTGPRIRPLRLIEGHDYDLEIEKQKRRPDPTTDPKEDAEIHAISEKAFREGDRQALGKIYEDVLDDMHSHEPGKRKASIEWFDKAFRELEAALTAELRELSRQERRYDWGYRVTTEGLTLRSVPRADGDTLECRLDKKALKARIQHAANDPKASAAFIVAKARDEMKQARAALIIQGPGAVPYEDDAARA